MMPCTSATLSLLPGGAAAGAATLTPPLLQKFCNWGQGDPQAGRTLAATSGDWGPRAGETPWANLGGAALRAPLAPGTAGSLHHPGGCGTFCCEGESGLAPELGGDRGGSHFPCNSTLARQSILCTCRTHVRTHARACTQTWMCTYVLITQYNVHA